MKKLLLAVAALAAVAATATGSASAWTAAPTVDCYDGGRLVVNLPAASTPYRHGGVAIQLFVYRATSGGWQWVVSSPMLQGYGAFAGWGTAPGGAANQFPFTISQGGQWRVAYRLTYSPGGRTGILWAGVHKQVGDDWSSWGGLAAPASDRCTYG